jgi:hypothetical protein
LTAVGTLTGCGGSSEPAPSSSSVLSTRAASSSPAASGGAHLDPVTGELVIDTGGTQVTGLAVA